MIRLLKQLIFNKYVWFICFPLLIGWVLLTLRIEHRTMFASYRQLQSVKRIWGGNLAQPVPSVRYKRFGSDVSELNRGKIFASDISVDLKVDYRKKGLIYYTGYHADFKGDYTIQNPENEKIYLSFIFPYPTKQGQGMLQDLKLSVNGEEDVEDTEYQPNLALWTGMLDGSGTLDISVRYRARGLNQFLYGFEPDDQVNQFTMRVHVIGADDLDYPEFAMPATEPSETTPEGKVLTWKMDRLMTQLNIGVILPDKLDIKEQTVKMLMRAPVFFVLFLISMTTILKLSGRPLDFLPIAMFSAAYFFFYPLFAYLSEYMSVALSFLISFFIIGLLIFNYSRTLYKIRIAVAMSAAYTFCLGITTMAALLPTYTGLILIVEGVILLFIVMQVLSRFRHVSIDLFGIRGDGKNNL